LEEEADRLGVSLQGTSKEVEAGDMAQDLGMIRDEAELQRRVLAARAAHQNAIINRVQTIGIIGGLVLTVILAGWNHSAQVKEQDAESNQRSADLTLALSQAIDSGQSKAIEVALDNDGNLDRIRANDQEIEEFLDHYEDVAMAYRHNLIDRDMAIDAFSYDLEKALRDSTIRRFISAATGEEADLYDGVLGLARNLHISYPPIVPTKPAARATP
jgi:hypothetical protein